jgi:hypothetical protein
VDKSVEKRRMFGENEARKMRYVIENTSLEKLTNPDKKVSFPLTGHFNTDVNSIEVRSTVGEPRRFARDSKNHQPSR